MNVTRTGRGQRRAHPVFDKASVKLIWMQGEATGLLLAAKMKDWHQQK